MRRRRPAMTQRTRTSMTWYVDIEAEPEPACISWQFDASCHRMGLLPRLGALKCAAIPN